MDVSKLLSEPNFPGMGNGQQTRNQRIPGPDASHEAPVVVPDDEGLERSTRAIDNIPPIGLGHGRPATPTLTAPRSMPDTVIDPHRLTVEDLDRGWTFTSWRNKCKNAEMVDLLVEAEYMPRSELAGLTKVQLFEIIDKRYEERLAQGLVSSARKRVPKERSSLSEAVVDEQPRKKTRTEQDTSRESSSAAVPKYSKEQARAYLFALENQASLNIAAHNRSLESRDERNFNLRDPESVLYSRHTLLCSDDGEIIFSAEAQLAAQELVRHRREVYGIVRGAQPTLENKYRWQLAKKNCKDAHLQLVAIIARNVGGPEEAGALVDDAFRVSKVLHRPSRFFVEPAGAQADIAARENA